MPNISLYKHQKMHCCNQIVPDSFAQTFEPEKNPLVRIDILLFNHRHTAVAIWLFVCVFMAVFLTFPGDFFPVCELAFVYAFVFLVLLLATKIYATAHHYWYFMVSAIRLIGPNRINIFAF